jgi:hypothetical protein
VFFRCSRLPRYEVTWFRIYSYLKQMLSALPVLFIPVCSSSLRKECSQFTFQMSNISLAQSSEEGTV